MWTDLYVSEKLRQLEKERALATPSRPPSRESLLSPLARAAGRALRRMGDGLESWAGAGEPLPDKRQPVRVSLRR